jgi:hypothetical protein
LPGVKLGPKVEITLGPNFLRVRPG